MTEKTGELPRSAKSIKIDPQFEQAIFIEPGGESLGLCYQCGTCTSSCPVSRFSHSYRPRTILKMAQLGMRHQIFSNDTLWLCAACFTCTDRCPQNVKVASVIRVLRNIAVKEGSMPAIMRTLASNVLETGYAYKMSELRQKKREETRLPPLSKADLESIGRFADASGLSKLIKAKEATQSD